MRDLGPVLARGRTADVHAWGENQVLKLFQPWADHGMVSHEQRIAKSVYESGVFTPKVGEIVSVGERLGLVFERVEAMSMLYALRTRPWQVRRFAHQFADLQNAMHVQQAEGLPLWKNRLADRILQAKPLPERLKEIALERLQTLPDGDRVCHGDFHPDNVLMTSKGPMVIDWIDAAAGHPMADVARTVLLTKKGSLPKDQKLRWLISLLRDLFNQAYMQRYFAASQEDENLVVSWLPVVAAARLDEGIDEEEATLLKLAEDGLAAYSGS